MKKKIYFLSEGFKIDQVSFVNHQTIGILQTVLIVFAPVFAQQKNTNYKDKADTTAISSFLPHLIVHGG